MVWGVVIVLLALGMTVEWGTPWTEPWSAAGDRLEADAEAPAPARFHDQLRSERYLLLADAVRDGDLTTARSYLATLSYDDRSRLGDNRTLLGLAAHADDEPAEARRLLAGAPDRGPLADWRHLALAELAEADPSDPSFRVALDHYRALIDDHPDSPLRPLALTAAANLYRDMGQHRRALGLTEMVRREGGSARTRIAMEVLAWEIGGELGKDAVRREAGRRLMIYAPWRASAMGVPEVFLDRGGQVDWRGLLSGDELERRAATFLELGQPNAARITLGEVAPAQRRLEWHLLMAQAFTELGRGREALAALQVPTAGDSRERALLEYRRGLAALSLAEDGERGEELAPSEREWMAQAAGRHLQRASQLTSDSKIAGAALRALYSMVDHRPPEEQHAVLASLRRHDPSDLTGAEPMWVKGWDAYRGGEMGTAVDWWSELAEIYPGSREAHRGLYWQARALEEMDRPRQARQVYDRLLATSDTTDFYRRQALVRLGQTPWLLKGAAEEMTELKPWEIDPTLARAKLLTDVGLDRLAWREAVALAERAEADDLTALEALILTRSGDHRRAMTLLRRAYPELGGPSQGSIPTEILRAYYPLVYADEIRRAARRTGLPPYLVAGIIRQESGFDPRATSPVGARGLMQVMPATAREVAASLDQSYNPERLYDPAFSILLGSTYFSRVLEMFDGNVELALAAYNGGPYRIRRMWRERQPGTEIDDFLETLAIDESRHYVKRILVLADSYRRLYPDEDAIEATPAG